LNIHHKYILAAHALIVIEPLVYSEAAFVGPSALLSVNQQKRQSHFSQMPLAERNIATRWEGEMHSLSGIP